MNTRSRRSILVAIIGIAAVGFVLAWPARDWRLYWQGRFIGWRSTQTGQLVVHETGLPGPTYRDYCSLLFERYGVTVKNHGCMPVVHEQHWQQGVNDAVSSYLRARYGKDVFKECGAEAQHRWEERHRAQPGAPCGPA